MKRRQFIAHGAAGLLAAAGATAGRAAEIPSPQAVGVITEPARQVPVVDDAEVVVCGGGPAGVTAAIAAARQGAKTVLLEAHGCLGGIWTSGLLSWILDYSNKGSLLKDILEQLAKREGRAFTRQKVATNAFDSETMKIVLEQMCADAGVRAQYHTRVCAARVEEGRRLTHVITESKSGREAVKGKVFIDCTGDGDLGAQAGCRFDFGHPETGRTQPMSMLCLLTGLNPEAVREYYREQDSDGPWAPPKDKLRAEMEKGGHSPSYSKPSLFRVRDGLFILMANHEYGFKGTDAREVTEATRRARRELHQLIDGLRAQGGLWRDLRIVATGEQIGVREGRRLQGLYQVSTDDLREGRRQPDGVCRVTFGIDVHSTNPKKEKGIEAASFRAKPYDIPLRALIARDIEGLMMAGRCISGDFIAHSSYRVTGNAAAMGEAAGVTAALAAKSNRLPREVAWEDIAKILPPIG